MIYLIDFWLLIVRLLPPILRQAKTTAWLWAMVKPVVQLHNAPSVLHPVRFPNCINFQSPSFISFKEHAFLNVSFNGQTIVLERLLNLYYYSFFDSTNIKGTAGYWIWIEDANNDLNCPFVFLKNEQNQLPTYSASDFSPAPPLPPNGSNVVAGAQYLYSIQDYLAPQDFIIHIPNALSFINIDELFALLDTYKLASTKYSLNFY